MKTPLKILICSLPFFFLMNAFVLPDMVEYDYIPIVHFDKQPIIEGKLNGQTAYFMLDSGSELSLLNSQEASTYEFEVSRMGPRDRMVEGIGGVGEKLHYVNEYELGLGMQGEIDASFYALRLDHLFDEMEEYRPIGILGGGLMRAYGFQIDFKNKLVRIKKMK
jgi:hypothetical protein